MEKRRQSTLVVEQIEKMFGENHDHNKQIFRAQIYKFEGVFVLC